MMGEGAASGLRSSAVAAAAATAGALGVAGAGLDRTIGAAALATGAAGAIAAAGAVGSTVADAVAAVGADGLASLAASSAWSGSSCVAAAVAAGDVGVYGALPGAIAGVDGAAATAAAAWALLMPLALLVPLPLVCKAIRSSCRAVLATTGCCGAGCGMAAGAVFSIAVARAASSALACCCCRSLCAAASRSARACSIFSCRSNFSACCAWAISRANCCFWVLLNWRPLPLPLACRAAICLCRSLDEGFFSSFLPRFLLCTATVLPFVMLLARACLLLRPAGAASACALPLAGALAPFLAVGVALAVFLSAALPLRLAAVELLFTA